MTPKFVLSSQSGRAQHPNVSRQGDEVRILQIFFIGFVRGDGPEEESLDRFGDFRIYLLG
jgi:hypothetical protein